MKANGKEILRWTAVAVFGGFAVWLLSYSDYYVIKHSNGDWFGSFFALGFTGLCVAPFVAVAYICFCRQYREFFSVLSAVGAFVVFQVLVFLLYHWRLLDSLDRLTKKSPLFAFLFLPVSLLCLFAPFFGAIWFYRFCRRLAQHPTPQSCEPPIIGVVHGG